MNMRKFLAGAVIGVASAAAGAVPIAYQGVLAPSVAVTGTVGGFSWFLDEGAGVDFWRFSGSAGQTVTFSVDRLNANLDPALSLYAGTTGADTSQFVSGASWGGLSYIGSLDDERVAFLTPGLGGDPFGSFVLGQTGLYTVVVGGSGSTDAGEYPYRLTLSVAAPIPEPSMWALLGIGLVGLRFLRRRRTA
ncbi:MAG: PEP-CTERM sorting domain-containing protein [Caldimonas sp.]